MYKADGVRVVTEKGHKMVECASSISVLIETVCVYIAKLGKMTVILTRPVGLVSKTAVEHGSLITMSKFAVAVFPSTVAVRVS
jgi:hypothetical protein